MIVKIRGTYAGLSPKGILVDIGNITYEVYLTAFSRNRFQSKKIGEAISLHTSHFIENSIAGGYMTPLLVGFEDETEKEFFQLFTSVNNIGVKTALTAITMPVSTIAKAIECSDVQTLKTLKGIGERTAKKIIASLHGKTADFALVSGPGEIAGNGPADPDIEDEATQILLQLGHTLIEARKMVKDTLSKNSNIQTVEELLEEVYKSRSKIS